MSKEERKLNILLSANGPHTNSGYGIWARDWCFRLLKDGWNVAVSAFYGIDSYPVYLHGEDLIDDRFKGLKLKCYPKMGHGHGSDAMVAHAKDFKANVVMSMQDVWPMDEKWLKKLRVWCPYCPIDKTPTPNPVLDKLKYAYRIVTFCDFGKETLAESGFSSTRIYEGTDTKIFKPTDKTEARKKFNFPDDAFVIGMVGANKENPPRKGYQEALEAFAKFSVKHPKAIIFFHTQQISPHSFPITYYAKHLGVNKKVFMMDPYKASYNSSSDVIRDEYNAFDVLLHPSQTEGFGLCLVESQACGTPVIGQRCMSMPELIDEGKTGWLAETSHRRFTNDGSFVNMADPESVYECLEKAYKEIKEHPKRISKACRKWVVDNYDIDKIVKNEWIPWLCELQEELSPR